MSEKSRKNDLRMTPRWSPDDPQMVGKNLKNHQKSQKKKSKKSRKKVEKKVGQKSKQSWKILKKSGAASYRLLVLHA